MAETDDSEVALKYIRFGARDWMSCDSVEDAIGSAYWMIEDNNGAPIEVVSLAGESLLSEKDLTAKISEYGKNLPPMKLYTPPPIPESDMAAAEAFSKFMGNPAASVSDWSNLSEKMKDAWRAKVAA